MKGMRRNSQGVSCYCSLIMNGMAHVVERLYIAREPLLGGIDLLYAHAIKDLS